MININQLIVFEYFAIKFDDNNTKKPDIKYRASSIRTAFQLMYKSQQVPIIKIWTLG